MKIVEYEGPHCYSRTGEKGRVCGSTQYEYNHEGAEQLSALCLGCGRLEAFRFLAEKAGGTCFPCEPKVLVQLHEQARSGHHMTVTWRRIK